MDQFLIAVISAATGAVVGSLISLLFPAKMAMKKEFASRDEMARAVEMMRVETEGMIRRLHDKVEMDQRVMSATLGGISLQIGRLEGKVETALDIGRAH